jgi:hypothetical protein
MQPSESSFDRVKSLLGKMDRSIDDARRRRLHDPEEEPAADPQAECLTTTDHAAPGTTPAEETAVPAPARPTSKYGRARPLRELGNPNGSAWQAV